MDISAVGRSGVILLKDGQVIECGVVENRGQPSADCLKAFCWVVSTMTPYMNQCLLPCYFAIVDGAIERFLSGKSWRSRISITIRRYDLCAAPVPEIPTDGESKS